MRKQPINNRSFGKLLKLFKKHINTFVSLQLLHNSTSLNIPPVPPESAIFSFSRLLDENIEGLHKKYKSSPFKRVSKFRFKTHFGEMKIGYTFDKDYKNIDFKMLVRYPGKAKFERKRQINIPINGR